MESIPANISRRVEIVRNLWNSRRDDESILEKGNVSSPDQKDQNHIRHTAQDHASSSRAVCILSQ